GPAMSASGGLSEALMFVATLIADWSFDESLAWDAAHQFEQDCIAGSLKGADWVEHGFAFDLLFEPTASFDPGRSSQLADDIREMAKSIAKGGMGFDLDLDVIVQPAEDRQKKLLVADMDSTIIGQECIDELADYAGFKPQAAAITERAMRAELGFAEALKERVALLAGLDGTVIGQSLAERVPPTP